MTLQARHINLSNSMLNPIYANSVLMAGGGGGLATTEICDGVMLRMAKTPNSHVVSRKRQREDSNTGKITGQCRMLGGQMSVQQFELDRLIYLHMEKVKREVEEKSRTQMNRTLLLIKEAIRKKLKEKEEEIEKMSKLSVVLQERAKSLYLENQLWRDLAQSHEAAANQLRWNLEQLLVQANSKSVDGNADAESCCGSSEEDEWNPSRRMCRRCGGMESRVLVLPCRHLCLCTTCGPAVDVCPVCKSIKNATLHVNFS